ncbi:hypothetical protein FNW25_11445 [Flavobacterium franklandianum]|uniref:Uncharacterized protein n=1 Tax=Flavobacterium franklandianum TaxID=2594430 RepID=A0A553CTK8_9FLAO|nr:hypothetical protein [Flavobacterium franklandianum]TRX23764.1 hypothetical protein FNW17_00890 [Flavobacterium franklandianum]TRX24531.1 hypothetical protein FNW25_11445 [Flavobacterium franklandianum]
MNFKKYQPLIEVTLLSILVYLAHKLVFFLNENNPNLQGFHFPIEVLYGFFFICSLLIIRILIMVNEKNINNVGFTFLLVTFIKMALSYVVLSPILNSGNPNVRTEKIDFFIIFALFLTIETIVTVRILNNKQ